jgi:hypothetical protein
LTPRRLGKEILWVLDCMCMVAAEAGSALRASIAVDAAMREILRSM